jgi:hypothetical protein
MKGDLNMSKLTALICNSCGGQIDRNTLTCTSCGTQYKYDDNGRLITVIEYNRRVVYLNGSFAIPSYFVANNPEEAMEISLHELAKIMAEKIMPLMELQTRYDPMNQQYITDVRVGVAEHSNYS